MQLRRLSLALLLCSLGVTLGVLSFAAPKPQTTAATSEWSIVPSPNSQPTPTNNYAAGLSCVSASDCWTVGYYLNAGVLQTMVQHWDGNAWRIVQSPNVSVTQTNVLRAVTCTSASDCWAVGSHYDGTVNQTLVLHWDGTAWSIIPSANSSAMQYNYLHDVACASPNECWAVGSYNNGTVEQTLVQRWDGTSWAMVGSRNTSTTEENVLRGVTCVAPGQCWAVGASINATTEAHQTLVQRWNGTGWTIVASPNSLLALGSRLTSVTCASQSDCWAVGDFSVGNNITQTFIARWDGNSWSVVSSPNTTLTQTNRLSDVTCVSGTDCWAVGHFENGGTAQTLIERWNGSAWSIVSSPNTQPTESNYLSGVSCAPDALQCWAVGHHQGASVAQSMAQRFTAGAWSIASSANANASQNNTLLGVDCAAPEDCWAVGSFFNGSAPQTQIQHWNGSEWSIAPSPNTGSTRSNILYDVECLSGAGCWAIGYHAADSAFQTLILHWEGASWAIVESPSTDAAQNNFLHDLECVSPNECWAVGFYESGTGYQTLALRWDGETWAIVPSANTSPTEENRLAAITCAAANDCWAVGRSFDGVAYHTLVQRWNGSSWNITSSPDQPGAPENNLYGVTCASASDCWAVGAWGNGGGTGQPFIQHWDGTSWSLVPAPNPTSGEQNYNFLRRVACTSPNECWAGGYSFVDGKNRTLILRWDGESWGIVETPNTSETQNNFLFGLSCSPATAACWATGYHYDDRGLLQTLTLRRASIPPPLLQITAIARLTNGHVVLQGLGAANRLYTLQASSALGADDFEFLASVTADETGAWQYEDAQAAELRKRFYRLVLSD